MTAVNWPASGIGWIVLGVIAVVLIVGLMYLHIRDSTVASIRVGLFMERHRTTNHVDPPPEWPDEEDTAELPPYDR